MQTAAFIVISSLLVSVFVEGIPGGKTNITDENLKQELLTHGLAKLHELKAASNGPACVTYTGTVLSATEQVVAGTNYDLRVEFSPTKKSTSECADADISAVLTETCDVNIWDRLGGQGKLVKVENCS